MVQHTMTAAAVFLCDLVQVVLSSVHAVKGLECVVCFVVGLDQKGWKYRETPTWPDEVKQVL